MTTPISDDDVEKVVRALCEPDFDTFEEDDKEWWRETVRAALTAAQNIGWRKT